MEVNMDKQELQKEIEKARVHLTNMEKMLKQYEHERWKPKIDDIFYSVDGYGQVKRIYFCDDQSCRMLYENFNCFKTYEQAKAEAEKILVRRMLEDIARRLNKGKEIDWMSDQNKYFIYLGASDILTFGSAFRAKTQGTIYCLDPCFLDVAIQEIGKERLKKYLRGE